ncbi:MAG: hypothetical protein AAB774_01840 [Patescibacteria group bacterium]
MSEVFFSLGLLIAVIGAGKYLFAVTTPQKQSVAFPSSSTERRLAITKAVQDGTNTYEFSTNFIPGIGTINDPQDYLSKWQDQFKNNTDPAP